MDFWGGAVPNWITALSAVGALVAAVVAGVLALRSYRLQAQSDEFARQQAGRARDHLVSAFWVTRPADGAWGIIVRNASAELATDISISVVGSGHVNGGTLGLKMLPSQLDFFVQSNAKSASKAWANPERVTDYEDFDPLLNSSRHGVTSVTFTLGTEQHSWTSHSQSGGSSTIE